MVPSAGFEPAHKYGLNVKPLPVGLRGYIFELPAGFEPAPKLYKGLVLSR